MVLTNLVPLLVMIGLMFSPLAALMAFVITYEEYTHHYPDKRKPLRLAAQAAAVTFVVFLALSAFIGFVAAHFF